MFSFCPEAPLGKDVITPNMSRIQWQHLEYKALRMNMAHLSTHGFIHLPRKLEREETDAAANEAQVASQNCGHSFTLHVYVNTSHILLINLLLNMAKRYLTTTYTMEDFSTTVHLIHASVLTFQNKSRFLISFGNSQELV